MKACCHIWSEFASSLQAEGRPRSHRALPVGLPAASHRLTGVFSVSLPRCRPPTRELQKKKKEILCRLDCSGIPRMPCAFGYMEEMQVPRLPSSKGLSVESTPPWANSKHQTVRACQANARPQFRGARGRMTDDGSNRGLLAQATSRRVGLR